MKNLLLILLLVCSPLLVFTQTGCKTPQRVIAYKSLAATQATVDAASKAFIDRYHRELVPPDVATKAMQASLEFNVAFNAAILLLRTADAPTPENVATAANAFLNVVSTFLK